MVFGLYSGIHAVAQGICDRSWHKVRCSTVGAIRRGTARAPKRAHTRRERKKERERERDGEHTWAPYMYNHEPLDTCLRPRCEEVQVPSSSMPEHPAWPARRAVPPLSPHLSPPHTTSPPASNANFPSLSLFGFIAHPRPSARGTVQSVQFNSPRGSIKIWMCP